MKKASPDEALSFAGQVIDVRSESEYAISHIPGAINIPVLDDFSRKEVGTVYRQQGREAAIARGLELTSPVLTDIYRRFGQFDGPLMLYCARGGMRSHSIGHVLSGFGRDVTLIDGGYKAYRELVLAQTPVLIREKSFIVLQGNTGVAKTAILHVLAERGFGVLDLEDLAKHSGSVFGHLAFPEGQPSQKQFENDFHRQLHRLPKLVLCESESRQIGRVYLPKELMAAMDSARHILLETSLDARVQTIMAMYAGRLSQQKPRLIDALNQLRRRLSNVTTDELIQQIKQDDLEPVIRYLMEAYYDPMYRRSVRREDYDYILELTFQSREEAIEIISNTIKEYLH